MRRVVLVWAAIAAVWSSHGVAFAEAEVSVSLRAIPSQIQVGDTFSLEVRASVKGGSLKSVRLLDLKKHPELEIVSHQTSRPMQVSFGFGTGMKVESSVTHVYAVRALAPGTYDFAPAVATVDGKEYESQPLQIRVGGSAASAIATDKALQGEDGADLSGAQYDPQAFVRTVVKPEAAFLGQQVDVAVYLYTRVGVGSRTVSPTKPTMDGFWVYERPIQNFDGTLVTVNGLRFRRYLLQQTVAFPQRTGELTIGAPKVSFETGGLSIFDASDHVERTGVPVQLEVKPLPQPGPADAFVGTVALTASLDRRTVETGNAVTLRVRAMAQGNIQDLRIELPEIQGVRTLQPVVKDERTMTGGVLEGIRTWEWILIPETPGEHAVAPIIIPYFDPSIERYGSTSTPELSFVAAGSAAPPAATSTSTTAPSEPSRAVSFGPIRVYSALSRGRVPLRKQTWFPWALAFPPFLFLLLTIGIGLSRHRSRARATGEAVQRELVGEARKALQDQNPRDFYDRIVRLINHAIESKTDEPVGGLSNAALQEKLHASGFDDDLVQRVINELEGADFARFAASGVNATEMERCFERTDTIIKRIQRVGGST